MSNPTTEFLIKLAENPGMLAQFRQDAESVIAAQNLSKAHQQLILSGDEQKLIDVAGLDETEARFLIV